MTATEYQNKGEIFTRLTARWLGVLHPSSLSLLCLTVLLIFSDVVDFPPVDEH